MNHTILVVEDEKGLRDAIAIYLRSQNYEVLLAANGAQGLEELGKAGDKIHLAIVDLMMPVMSGYEASRVIRSLEREDAKTVPIIALSANAFEEDVALAKDAGMDAHLAKPVDIRKMFKVMNRLRGR